MRYFPLQIEKMRQVPQLSRFEEGEVERFLEALEGSLSHLLTKKLSNISMLQLKELARLSLPSVLTASSSGRLFLTLTKLLMPLKIFWPIE